MKNLINLRGLIVISSFLTVTAIAATDSKGPIDVRIGLYKDCQLHKEMTLNETQRKAYQSLKQHELVMHELQKPVKQLEQQIAEYSNKIEALSVLVIQETDTSLHIDKNYLQQQELLAAQFGDFMAQHQHSFDALGVQGLKIAQLARDVEQSLAPLVGSIDYDHQRIIEPDKRHPRHRCQNDMIDI